MNNHIGKLTTRTEKVAIDLAEQLADLLKAGWTEHDIVRLARMRASYARLEGDAIPSPSTSTSSPSIQLVFARWLYQNKRLFS